jgi:hypothetical protein
MFGKFAIALGTAFWQLDDHRHRNPADENSVRNARQNRRRNKKLSREKWADFGENSQRKAAIIAIQSETEEFSKKQTYQRKSKKDCRV